MKAPTVCAGLETEDVIGVGCQRHPVKSSTNYCVILNLLVATHKDIKKKETDVIRLNHIFHLTQYIPDIIITCNQ